MRLVGYEFSGAHGPVGNGFLELGDLTILFGANDVGKSRLLRTVAAGAGSLDALIRGDRFSGNHRFFVKLHQEDAKQLLQATYQRHLDELQAAGIEEDPEPRDPSHDLPWLSYLPPDARDLHPQTSTFALEALAEWCGKPAAGAPGLLVAWCRKAEPLTGRHTFSAGDGAVLMGTVDLPVLPVPVEVPVSDPAWLRREVADAIADWLAHIHWGVAALARLKKLEAQPFDEEADSAWIDLADAFGRSVERRPSPRELWTLVEVDDGSVAYRPTTQTACRFVSQIATRLAPSFVRDRYVLRVAPVPILDWRDGEPIRVSLKATTGEHVYDLAEVADGLRLWIEIALLEAADAMRRVELNLRNALLDIERADDADARSAAIRAYLSQLAAATEDAVDPPFERSLGAAFALAPGMDSPWRDDGDTASDVARRVASARPRLYLLDEPERHLNPRLQRAAARWLVDLLQERGSQGLIATHAHPFLNVGPGPAFVEVRRDGSGSSKLVPFEPHELTAYSEIAKDVGLDRGELLTGVRVLAFVEGRHDQVVLEELFSLSFHHAGVVLVPIAGVGRHAQIVEHDVLIRFTRAALAVVFDKLDHKTIVRLQADENFRRDSLRSRQTELQAMASLLHRAIEHGREVRPLPLPVADIFDALDEEIVKGQYPTFPGHAEANAAWTSERKRVPNRKVFYQERYRVPNSIDTYRKIAALMRTSGRIPAELSDLGADLERMAAEEG